MQSFAIGENFDNITDQVIFFSEDFYTNNNDIKYTTVPLFHDPNLNKGSYFWFEDNGDMKCKYILFIIKRVLSQLPSYSPISYSKNR